jgi:predicted amidohydrolase
MRAAALQFDVRRDDPEANLRAALGGLDAAAEAGVDLVCLPEMWPTSFPAPDTDLDGALDATRRAWEAVGERAADAGLVVCGSGFGRVEGAARPTNRLRLLDGARALLEYDTLHLFSPTAEPAWFSAGSEPPATVEVRGARVSGLVCYDLRFPELCRVPFRDGCEVLCVAAQWPVTRAAHWRALVVALAVSNQCFVVAANRTGSEVLGEGKLVLEFPGNSLVVDPHGTVLAEGAGRAGLVAAELDLDVGREYRRRVPVRRDSRDALYAAWYAERPE